jgi:hypothetical protein
MNGPERLIQDFYLAFERLDATAMAKAYAPDAVFEDEVFRLQGRDEIGAMWAMLCEAIRKNGLPEWRLTVSGVQASETRASAHWEPVYRFSATGRMVHNVIDAQFELRGGLIVSHRDSFSFHRWARQALGPTGWLLGWTPLVRRKVRAQAARSLAAFRAPRPVRSP